MKCIGRFGKWILIASSAAFLLTGCARIGQQFKAQEVVRAYEAEHYNKNLYTGELFASDLCVASENVAFQGAPDPAGLHAAGLFDVEDGKVDFAYNLHDRLYPASTTKIMTALVALKKGNLTDMVTVQADADAANFAADEKTCGIKAGDQMTLGDLLHGLLMESGNDAAVAIADYIGGNSEQFAQMMNEEAQALMATKTHFLNSNGLHNENHYTTAYDLYLIFNECIKHDEFVDIINTAEYTANITGADKNNASGDLEADQFLCAWGSRTSAERDDYRRENRYHGTGRELPDSLGEGFLRQAVHIYRHGSRYKIPAIPGHDSDHQWDRAARTSGRE